MPGIAGIITKNPQDQTACLSLMLRSLAQEHLHTSGTYSNPELGVWTGWVCDTAKFDGCMPVWNERRDVCLVFAGEDFTDRPEVDKLRLRGHTFNETDASYLVHLYEEMGMEFLQNLNGWFAGLLIDLREQSIVLFTDRYGIGRVYIHECEEGLYFSSEAKSLLRILPSLRKLDLRSLGEFYSCGCVLQNRTLFVGVSLLPPASAWVFHAKQLVAKKKFFDVNSWEHQPLLDAVPYHERMKETWARILPRYFRGDRVALSLTGGVDSRMILAWAPRSEGALPCYTFGGRFRDCADVKISRKVAQICRQEHKVIPVDGEFLSQFPVLAEQTVHLSDGTMDVTGAIDLYVQRLARKIAPVRVTGTNGGEILRSLVAFKPTRLSEALFDQELLWQAQHAERTYANELRCHPLSFTAFKQAPWYMNSKFVVERSEVTLRMPYFDNDLVSLVYQAPPEAAQSNDVSLRLIADGNPALGSIATDRGIAFSSIPGLTQARNLFHEFTFKAEYAYDYGMPQWMARVDNALRPLRLERLFLGRHKFHHFRVFYRDELAGYVEEILLDPRTKSRPFLNAKVLEDHVLEHTKGVRNHTLEIHKLLTVELVHRTLIGQN